MQFDNVLRMALVFGENQAPTFANNLEKMIALTLYEKEKQNEKNGTQKGMTITDIMQQLKDTYGLSFSDSEIVDIIYKKNQKRIICIDNEKDYAINRYTISAEEFKRIESKEDTNLLPTFVEQFLLQNPDIVFSKDELLNLLKKHFYVVFNSNATVILELINRQYEYIGNLKKANIDFDMAEKDAINRFLNWDNIKKNEYIYELISCCFDYCMMTSEQTSDAYKAIFKQKVFYLDANIVFRMMGLNHINRKRVIDTFLKKCKEVGIKIRITNQTRKEINDTITYYVRLLGSEYGKSELISPEITANFGVVGSRIGFYTAYYEWCKEPTNRIGDFRAFENYLKKKANNILGGIEQKDYDSYAETNKDKFDTWVTSLDNYKRERNKSTNLSSVKTDVNNYMFIVNLNNTIKGTDFFNIHNYLISADHAFCDWVKEIRPETIPVVVLPSIWYSIMLKYTKRTKEDFESFVSFLNFSMSNNDEKNSAWKIEVLKKVLQIQEPIDIKEEMAYCIGEELKTGKIHDLDSEEMEDLVDKTYQSIVEQKVNEAIKAERKENDNRFEKLRKDTQREIDAIKENSLAEIRQAKQESADTDRKMTQSYTDGRNEAINDIIEKETEEKTKSTYLRYWFYVIAIVAIILALALYFCITLAQMEKFTEGQRMAGEVIKITVPIITSIISVLLLPNAFCKLDKNIIRERVHERVKRKYNQLNR